MASNDVMFSAKVGHFMNKFEVSSKSIYCVTRNAGTLTTNLDKNIFESRLEVHIRFYNFLKHNLSKEEFKVLRVSGRPMIKTSINSGYGFWNTWIVYNKLRRNNVEVIDKRIFNPLFLLKSLRDLILYYKNKKLMI